MLKVLLICMGIVFIGIIYGCFIVSCSDAERKADDEEQLKYISEWKEKHSTGI